MKEWLEMKSREGQAMARDAQKGERFPEVIREKLRLTLRSKVEGAIQKDLKTLNMLSTNTMTLIVDEIHEKVHSGDLSLLLALINSNRLSQDTTDVLVMLYHRAKSVEAEATEEEPA